MRVSLSLLSVFLISLSISSAASVASPYSLARQAGDAKTPASYIYVRAEPPAEADQEGADVLEDVMVTHWREWRRLEREITQLKANNEHLRPEGARRLAELEAQVAEARRAMGNVAEHMHNVHWVP
ncbi:hypothetical protein OC834_005438 [Tilletia horrida]|nr:hypothetical protein OC834_005438 [Tilletia horrida]